MIFKVYKFGLFTFLLSFSLSLDAQISFVAMKTSTGQVLSSEGVDHMLVPASIQKVIIAGLALDKLGADYRYETVVGYTGSIDEDGVLTGDIVIQGGGDPTLASKYDRRSASDVLTDIVARISKAGITCVNGKLVVDASLWGTDCVAPTWPWYDLGNYYAAGAWGFNYMDNAHELTFTLSETVKTGPRLIASNGPPNTNFTNELVTGSKGSGDQAYVYGGPFQDHRFVRGSLPVGKGEFTIRASLAEPPKFFVDALYAEMNENGIQIQNGHLVSYTPFVPSELQTIFSIKSSKLEDILRVMLLKSDNIYAEAVFRSLSNRKSYQDALRYYVAQLRKMGFTASSFYDGCGLSPFNRMSAMELTNFIQNMASQQPGLLSILPSVDHTSWRPYFANDNLQVKSGYMEGVRSYCGVVNNDVAFVAIYNGPDFKKADTKKTLAEFLLKVLND